YRPSIPTRLYDRNGRVFAELFRHKQELTPLQQIPAHVIQAFLAVEDDNFYNHFGIDILGIMRAMMKNILAGRVVQGGSTLTQQLAKQIYLNAEGIRKRTLYQKIRETLLALQIEHSLSKEEILEVYFNVIYLGHGCKGLACASRVYFNKKVEDLTLAEAALLSRLPKSPVDYSPFRNPERAKEQHKFVLNRMAEVGFIDHSEIKEIHDDFWNEYWGRVIVQSPSRNIWANKLDLAPYFTDYVRQILEAVEEVGPEIMYTRGLRVYTTLDLDQQRIADEELHKMLEKVNKVSRKYAQSEGKGGVDMSLFNIFQTLSLILPVGKPQIKSLSDREKIRRAMEEGLLDPAELLSLLSPSYNSSAAFEELRKDTVSFLSNLEVQGAFVTIEPRTGYITTMIGGADFSPQNQYNRALYARRQPGSAFKIFVYGSALRERAMGTNSTLNDAPFFAIDKFGSTWSPGNYDEGFRGLVTASTAMALSLNTCSVQVYYKIGASPIIDFANTLMKISSPRRFNSDPALALGASEVTPIELATAVAIISNEGKDVIPFPIRYVTDQSGNVLYNQESRVRKTIAAKTRENKVQIIEPGLAYLMKKMMTIVANRGTATRGMRDQGGFKGDIAVKTGTTSSWSDAWIAGFNPEYATVIWFGFDKSSITMGPGHAGGSIAAPVLGSFMKRYYSEMNMDNPEFKKSSSEGSVPEGIIPDTCGGLALAPVRDENGNYIKVYNGEEICAGEEHKIYDQRELLMKELGITKKDLGVGSETLKFKNENN
ncbi:MAG: PBP1A family penicillin-binding protein, partial [Spirochaetia bacterium]|nr:PBP1A family penicillin-binding protein [Spirochaetia bacterium]